MVVCLNEGRKRGYTHFRIAGCMGGRFDHTLANMASLCDCAERGEEAWMCDGQNRVRVLTPGSYELTDAAAFDHVSLLAFSPEVTGITLTGTEWELKDAVLTQRYPLGCSNIARSAAPRLRFETGLLTLVYSKGG